MTGNYDPSETIPSAGDPETYFRQVFKRQQEPVFWLLSARINKDSAEAIFADQLKYETTFDIQQRPQTTEDTFEDDDPYGEHNDKQLRLGQGYFYHLREGPHYQAAWLLYGLAIENTLKGLTIANNPTFKKDNRLHKKIAIHNLNDLAFLAKVPTDQYERNLLTLLTNQISWAGRYPIPLQYREIIPKYVGKPHRDQTSSTGWPELRFATRRLYHRLDGMVYDWITINVPRDVIDIPMMKAHTYLP